jgi:iron complex outermembrane receptor protein
MNISKGIRLTHLRGTAGIAALIAAGTFFTSGALAQQAAPTSGDQIEQVVVTAQHRAENQQNVPIAVSVISPQMLQNVGARSLQDLSATVPGFVTTQSAGYGAAPLTIRGVGGANGGGNFFADEPVATYIDGVYIGRLSVATSDLVDIDSIQVLRGPQGTLYGRNATAGAVLITTKRPTDDFEGHVEAGVDSLGGYRGEVAFSGPLAGEQLLGRVAAAYTDYGGWGKNVINGDTVNNGRDITARGSLRYQPTESLTVDLIGEHFNQHFDPGLFRIAQVTGGPADSPYVRRPDFEHALNDSLYAADTQVYNHITTDSVTLDAAWRPEAVNVDFISSYRTFNVNGQADSDNTAPANRVAPLTSYNSAQLRNWQDTQELRVSSPDGQGRLSWTTGLFYMHEDNRVDPFLISTSSAYFGLGTKALFNAYQRLDAYAAFADASYELAQGLTLHLGERYSYENKNFDVSQLVTTLKGGFSPAVGHAVPAGFKVAAPPQYVSQADFSHFTGRAVLDYKITSDVMTYASFSQGFKSGGFNAFGLTPAFKPETLDAYELGLKSDWFDRMLQVNLDGFHYNYQNLQVRQGVPTGGVSIANVAGARVQGVELETLAAPADGLTFGFNATYLDAEFTKGSLQRVPLTATFKFGANLPLQTVNIAGNALSRAPKWQLGGTAGYETPISDALKIGFGGDIRYQTNEFFSETQQTVNTFESGAWTEVDVHASLGKIDGAWNVTLYGNNIFNNRHLTQVTPLSSFPYGTINNPATAGIRVDTNF